MRLNNAAASVQLMKGLKETEVLCSETLFRCISPSMDVIPVTVYRLAPNSIVSDADHLSISVCLYSTLRTSYSIVESSLIGLTGIELQLTATKTLFTQSS